MLSVIACKHILNTKSSVHCAYVFAESALKKNISEFDRFEKFLFFVHLLSTDLYESKGENLTHQHLPFVFYSTCMVNKYQRGFAHWQ